MIDQVGPYHVLAELGAGASGHVFRARRAGATADVAVKLLDPALARDAEAVYRFHREMKIARDLAHPHLVPVLDSGDLAGVPYLVMELVDGISLDAALASRGALGWRDAARIAGHVAAGLASLHAAGIAHRDLKPSNVLLTADGTARLTDFGLARAADSTHVTQTGAFIGTLKYIAPEILAGEASTRASDTWSLGMLLYQMLAGRPPFDSADPRAWVQQVLEAPIAPPSSHVTGLPAELDALVLALLERKPDARPDAARLSLELAALAARPPASKPPRPAPGISSRPPLPFDIKRERGRRPLTGPALMFVVSLTLFAASAWLASRPPAAVATTADVPVAVTSPAPPAIAVEAFDWDGVRAVLADVDAQYKARLDSRNDIMQAIEPAARNYAAGAKGLAEIRRHEAQDLERLTGWLARLDAAFPDLSRLPTPRLVLAARLVLTHTHCWCGVDNCTQMGRVLERAARADPGFEGGLRVLDELSRDPFEAGGVPFLVRTLDTIELVTRRLAASPAEAGPDVVGYLINARSSSYFYTYRPFPADARTRVTSRIAAMRQALAALSGPCGQALGGLLLALWDHGSGRKGLKAANLALTGALDALVAAPDCLPSAREIRATLDQTLR